MSQLSVWVFIHALMAMNISLSYATPLLPLSIDGNRLVTVDSSGNKKHIQLHGVSATGANFECVQGRGLWDGPTDAAYRAALKTWNINAIRVTLNEDCLLGLNGVNPLYSGSTYVAALKTYVHEMINDGFYLLLTLHWSAPGTQLATGQQPMPDQSHSIDFWTVLSKEFGHLDQVIFDVFNEPFPGNNTIDSAEAWECWKNGGSSCKDINNYVAVGFDTLVSTIRSLNATNILMLGGINYSNSLTRWLEYVPTDPLNKIAASWHSYSTNHCNNLLCWETYIKPVMAKVPVITGELGELDCQGIYIVPLMQWLDSQGNSSYLAWVWQNWNCDAGPSLITDFNGTCTDSYGCDYKSHILPRD